MRSELWGVHHSAGKVKHDHNPLQGKSSWPTASREDRQGEDMLSLLGASEHSPEAVASRVLQRVCLWKVQEYLQGRQHGVDGEAEGPHFKVCMLS